MKALTPYLATAALLLPPPVATIRATLESTPETRIFVDRNLSGPTEEWNEAKLAIYTWDIKRPELAPTFVPGLLIEDSAQEYEPFIAAEAWREIPGPEDSIKIEFEDPPSSFFDEHDLAAIAVYESD